MKKLFVLPLVLLLSVSCNELRQDQAQKNGIQLIQGASFPANYKTTKEPDSLTAFLWPTEEFFNRQKEAGVIDARDYQDYIANTSAEVFLSGDEFDEWSEIQLTKGEELAAEIEKLENERAPIQQKYNEIRKEHQNERKNHGRKDSAAKKEEKKVAPIASELAGLEEDYSVENCQATPDTETCKDLESKITSKRDELDTQTQKAKVARAEADDYHATKVKPLEDEMDRIKKDELDPIVAERSKLEKEQGNITKNQALRLSRVQSALDPQATKYVRDDSGQIMYGQDNRPMIDYVEESSQVNWVKTYVDYVQDKNIFDIKDGYIDIRFGEWGIGALDYKTVYQKDDNGNVVMNVDGSAKMAAESDFSKMIYLGRNVYEFHMIEKDANGNRTGRIFEFKVERSPFSAKLHTKVLGDITVTNNGAVERRGQIKLILVRSN
ncbi:MAG: hypothetical protein EP319_02315 [Deltaproteobacteria bacterium]|nr:MAG: hypothetical protein EP319_02315 [Deltaproteobacteria bacterium]